MIGWLFPGQGSQRPGMAAGLESCKALFEVAGPIAGTSPERLCNSKAPTKWPAHLLQPAIFITSVGAARSVEARGQTPDAVAGHSLGEFAALVAAGAMSFEDALRLVTVRGRAMSEAGRRNPGGMAAVLHLQVNKVMNLCGSMEGVWIANFNTDSQTVISGKDQALAQAAERCLEAGARRVVRLDVPIAAHTPLMERAAAAVEQAIQHEEIVKPRRQFFSVVDAQPHGDPEEIRRLLVEGITSPVRFAETVGAMAEAGIANFVEVGPGNVLRGLVKQNLPEANLAGVSSDEEAEALAFGLRRMQPA